MDKRERATAEDIKKKKKKKKQRRPNLLEEKENENSIAAVSKMRNTSGHQRENE